MAATTVERIAGWAAGADLRDVPDDVLDLSRAQRRSVLGAVAASASDAAARRVLDAVKGWAGDGPAPLLGTERSVSVEDALYGATALSIALDFDDYVCFGHSGHSAVLVPLLLAFETGSSADEQLAAQVVANEVEARLGGACLIGPLNGQLWSFIHCAGAALAAGRLLGLDVASMAHALAISLYQAPRPTVPGFMAPDSKLLTAAEPTVIGLRAARLAAAGVTGPLDALDHPQGFLGAFAYTPLRGLLDGLGEGWATRTLSIKRYPGCAYVDTTVDALLSMELPPPDEVDSVLVEAGILTTGMDALSSSYARAGTPTPVTVNFSIPWNVAIVLVAGRLTPDEVDATWLEKHEAQLSALARRVQLVHRWDLTMASADAFGPLLPPRALARDAGTRRLLRGVRQTRAHHRGLEFGIGDVGELVRLVRQRGSGAGTRLGSKLWSPAALDAFRMAFPARVVVRHRDGTEQEARVDVPTGAAGHPTLGPVEAGREKLATWGPRLWGDDAHHSAFPA